MTRLLYQSRPVVRLTPVEYRGKEVVVELHPWGVLYRLKGSRELTRIDHLVAIEAGFKVQFRENGGKI